MIELTLSKVLGEKRITQKALAKITGIRPNTISEMYNDVSERVNLEHLDVICDVLDCDLSDLITRRLNPQKKTTVKEKKS